MARHRSLVGLAVACAVLVAAFSLGRRSAPTRVEHDRQVERVSQLVPAATARGPNLEAVRAVVREELARQAPAPGGTAGEQAVAEPEDESAMASAREVLARGMADGRWTTDDRDRLRAELGHLSGEQAQDIFHTLIPALNSDQLRADFDGPLF